MIDFLALVIVLSEEIFEKIFKSSEEEISVNEFQTRDFIRRCAYVRFILHSGEWLDLILKIFSYV